jgi:uncharacterized iron-regulated protein
MKMDNKKMVKSQTLKATILSFIVFFFGITSSANYQELILGDSQKPILLTEALAKVTPGTIVLLGEQHAHSPHQLQQVEIISELKKMGHRVHVGMEFFAYPFQGVVDRWRSGAMTEADFLTEIGWGKGFSFDFYRQQVLLPVVGVEMVLALNAPRILTSKVAKNGIGSLNDEEQALLPPNFAVGNQGYLERFQEAAGAHCPNLQNCFTAQSIWDDTMAWRAVSFLRENKDDILVIIVGEFHVQYGGGLKDRIQARGWENVVTFSLLNMEGLSPEEIQSATEVSPKYGKRADYLWLSRP